MTRPSESFVTPPFIAAIMNSIPDWQDGDCCFRCRTQFTIVSRKHHCRNCGNIFCAKCSSQQIPLPKLNIEKSVRVCDGCYEKIVTKNEDPLKLALDREPEQNKTGTKTSSSTNGKSSTNTSSSSSSKTKPPADASAPSEQDLKEEEELQLALALSLSEASAKISFPDVRSLEEPIASNSTANNNSRVKESKATNNKVNNDTDIYSQPQRSFAHEPPLAQVSTVSPSKFGDSSSSHHNNNDKVTNQIMASDKNLARDQELFRFIAEVHSIAEVFMNRINSNKIRNRPIKDDAAIQSLFMKITEMHAILLEHIKVHDADRARFERIQDKLSQIADARAALDALREEHAEKVRQEAAEAERLRQTQLASKLEMMRQKKSQMMQYQREIALQRIQAQQMILQQPQPGFGPAPSTSVASSTPTTVNSITLQQQQQQQQPITTSENAMHDASQHQYATSQVTPFQPPAAGQTQPQQYMTTLQSQIDPQQALAYSIPQIQPPQLSYTYQPQVVPTTMTAVAPPPQAPAVQVVAMPSLPVHQQPKPEDDAPPLISFDD